MVNNMTTIRNAKRVAEAVRDRRDELGLSQAQFAVKAEISQTTLGKIEAGTINQRTAVIRRVETALGWTPGTIARILGGGEPDLPVEDAATPQTARLLEQLAAQQATLDKLSAAVSQLAESISHLTPAPVDAKRGRGLRR